jgi:hypothetical protein
VRRACLHEGVPASSIIFKALLAHLSISASSRPFCVPVAFACDDVQVVRILIAAFDPPGGQDEATAVDFSVFLRFASFSMTTKESSSRGSQPRDARRAAQSALPAIMPKNFPTSSTTPSGKGSALSGKADVKSSSGPSTESAARCLASVRSASTRRLAKERSTARAGGA